MARLAVYAFVAYCCLRGIAVFLKPEKMLELFPGVPFDVGGAVAPRAPSSKSTPAENAQIALSCARACRRRCR